MNINGFFDEEGKNAEATAEESFNKEEWAELKQAERDAMKETVPDQLKLIRDEAEWRESFLQMTGRLRKNYSLRNLILINSQCPEASLLFGFDDWKAKGYRINQGEKGIRIYEPSRINSEDGSIKTVFNVRSVFDISQTNAPEALVVATSYDKEKLINAIAAASPYPIYPVEDLPNGIFARTIEGKILIRKGATPRQVFGPLFREVLRLRIGLKEGAPEGPCAVFAASCSSFIITKHYGLEGEMSDFAALINPPEEIISLEPDAFGGLLDTAIKAAGKLFADMSFMLEERQRELDKPKQAAIEEKKTKEKEGRTI